MIAGETISILKEQDSYDTFFRRRRKRRRKGRTKAQRKARRRKFWQGVGDTIKHIGGFQGVGSTLDAVTGMSGNTTDMKEIATPPISTTDPSGISFQVGGDATDKEKSKPNKMGIYRAIGGVVLLIAVIGTGLYLHKKSMSKEVLTPA